MYSQRPTRQPPLSRTEGSFVCSADESPWLKTSIVNVMSCVTAWGQLQYFRVQPRDVKVHEGGEVTMQCEVANRAGFVQWTKDGFALGKLFQIYHYYFYLK